MGLGGIMTYTVWMGGHLLVDKTAQNSRKMRWGWWRWYVVNTTDISVNFFFSRKKINQNFQLSIWEGCGIYYRTGAGLFWSWGVGSVYRYVSFKTFRFWPGWK